MSSFCNAKATHIFQQKISAYLCVSLDVNFNESLTNDIVSFEQLGSGLCSPLTYPMILLADRKALIRWQAALGLHCPHMPEYTFLHGIAHLCGNIFQNVIR